MSAQWSAPIGDAAAYRRASGRRHYNSVRRDRARYRQVYEVQDLLAKYGFAFGVQAAIARKLGVSPATISRDIKALLAGWNARCPHCGGLVCRPDVAGIEGDMPHY